MSVGQVGRGRLDIAEVLGDTFAVIGADLPTLAIVALLLNGVPLVLETVGTALIPSSPAFGLLTILGALALLVGLPVFQGALIYATMQGLHGQRAGFGKIIQQGLRKFWPIAGLFLLIVLGTALAVILLIVPWRLLGLNWPLAVGLEMLLLIVPAIMLVVAWSAILPAIVIEDVRVFSSFKRSAELTRGRRWSIFLLMLIWAVVTLVIELVLAALFGGFGAGAAHSPFQVYVAPLLNLVVLPFGVIMNTALFNQLRGREGYGSGAVAEVFA